MGAVAATGGSVEPLKHAPQTAKKHDSAVLFTTDALASTGAEHLAPLEPTLFHPPPRPPAASCPQKLFFHTATSGQNTSTVVTFSAPFLHPPPPTRHPCPPRGCGVSSAWASGRRTAAPRTPAPEGRRRRRPRPPPHRRRPRLLLPPRQAGASARRGPPQLAAAHETTHCAGGCTGRSNRSRGDRSVR